MEHLELGTERVHLRSPSINVSIKADIRGNISKEKFQEALNYTVKRYAILRSSIGISPNGQAYYDIKDGKTISGTYIEGNCGWEEQFHKMDDEPFNFSEGSLLRAALIYEGMKSTLIIVGHHLIGDGLSFAYIAEYFINALNNNTKGVASIPAIIGTNIDFKYNTIAKIRINLIANKINQTWRKNTRIFTEQEFAGLYEDYRKNYGAGLYLYEIDNELLDCIIRKCKEEKVTVNSAFVCAFMASVERVDPQRVNNNVGIAVNIRNDLIPRPNRELGNLVSGIQLQLKYDDNKPFWANAISFQKKIKRLLNDKQRRLSVLVLLRNLDPNLIDSISYSVYGNFENKTSRIISRVLKSDKDQKSIGCSNLGVFDCENDGEIRLNDIVFIPPAFPANDINF